MRSIRTGLQKFCRLSALAFLPFLSGCAGDFDPNGSRPPVEFFADHSGQTDIDRIRALGAEDWRKVDAGTRLNFGYSPATYWVRFFFPPSTHELFLEVRNPHLDRVELFAFDSTGLLRHGQGGDLLPFAAREISHRHFVFRVPPGTTTVFLKVASEGSLALDFSLDEQERFQARAAGELFLFGGYYGILVLMAFFYALVAFVFKRKNSVYYVLHVLTYGLFQITLDGLGFQYLWGDLPRFENHAILVLVPVAVFSAAWFVRSFLLTKQHAPWIDRALVGLGLACVLSIPLTFLVGYGFAIRLQTGISALFALVALAAGARVVRVYRPARFFLAAWCFFLVGIVAYALFVSGVLPGLFAARYGLQIGSVLEMSILSVAILDRIRQYRQQREQAREQVLRGEREQARLKEDINRRLEEEVRKKTGELAGALEELQRRDSIIKRELRLAQEIQAGILPPERLELKGLRVGTYHSFMTGVGGDYYDVFRISENRLGLLMADVSGHGIPAALVTVMAKISFMNVTRLYGSPLKIMEIVNRVLARSLSPLTSLSYLTAFLLTLDQDYNVLYTSAAHPSPLVFRKSSGQVEEWEARGSILGCLPDDQTRFSERQDRLYPGDRVFLYTDGITEGRDRDGEEFGLNRVETLLRETVDLPPHEACQRIAGAFEDFTRGAPAEDDVSFLLAEADPDCRGDLDHFGES